MMKRSVGYLLVPSLMVPAFLALWFAQYLIENFFPDVTLIDLGAFYAIGFISGISTGLTLLLSKNRKANR